MIANQSLISITIIKKPTKPRHLILINTLIYILSENIALS